ncbi:MAG: rhamnulokinase [bacterium]|nr:rhamnulokinase [bacterium]
MAKKTTQASKTRNYLALDLGAESGRGIVGRFDGKKIKLEEVYRFGHTPLDYNGTLRWDVLVMALHLRNALAAAVAKTSASLASLGVDTWGVDYVLLDRNDDLLGYPFHYRDARTDVSMPAVWKEVGKEAIFKVTGLQFQWFNTLYQLFADVLAGAGRLEAARTMMFMPDFLGWTLGGEKSCEYTIASTSQMLDARKRTWARSLLRSLGIPDRILMPLTQPGTVTGRLHADVVAATGAPSAMKVVAPGCHDTASAVAAVPASGEGWAYLSSGTWSLLGAELAEPIINDAVMAENFTNEGGLAGTIRFLKNIMGLWLVQELRRAWTDDAGNAPDYATLTREAAEARPFGSIVDCNWTPFSRPGQMPEKIVKFCKGTGQQPPATRGEYVRCALESLALAYRQALEALERTQGRRIDRIHIVGGGTKNLLLNQLAADACGREVLAGPEEATALGNILAQMLADKKIKSLGEGRRIIAASFSLKRYKPHDSAAWDDAYGRYVKYQAKSVKFASRICSRQ